MNFRQSVRDGFRKQFYFIKYNPRFRILKSFIRAVRPGLKINALIFGFPSTAQVHAQTAWAKGFAAQREGNGAQTLAYYYEASGYDPSFKEAAAVANTLAVKIKTGSLGENIRNDIAWREEWQHLIDEAEAWFLDNPPVVAQLVYDPALKQGKVDYEKKTVDFELRVWLPAVQPPSIRMLEDLAKGLKATKRNDDWNLTLPFRWSSQIQFTYAVNFELLNDTSKVIDRIPHGKIITPEEYESRAKYFTDMRMKDCGYDFGSTRFILYRENDKYSVSSFHFRGDYESWSISDAYSHTMTFSVSADNITDLMTVRVGTLWQQRGQPHAKSMVTYGPDIIPVMTLDKYKARCGRPRLKVR
jgi:hypothetical protein